MGDIDDVFSFLRGSENKTGEAAALTYVLAMKFVVRSRAEQNEIAELEEVIRLCGISDIVLDNVAPGHNELNFWFHVANPKRAFKQLSEMPKIAEHLSTLQAGYAERSKMKFSVLWPKGGQAHIPAHLR